MKKLFAIILALVTLFACCKAAFAVTHYGTDNSTTTQEEGAYFLLDNSGNIVGAIRLDEFTQKIRQGSSAVALSAGNETITGILTKGKILRCKNLKSVLMNQDKTLITAGETYLQLPWQVINPDILDEHGITCLSDLTENTKFSITINGKDYSGHRCFANDAGIEVARIYLSANLYISVYYADWDDGIVGNKVLGFRAGAKPYNGSNNNNSKPTATPVPQQPTATPAPQQPTVTPVPQQPTATPAPQQPVVTPAPQQPSNTPNPQYQPVVTPPTMSGNNNTGSSGNSGSSNNNSGNSGNVPNPEYQQGTLPGGLGDFWN